MGKKKKSRKVNKSKKNNISSKDLIMFLTSVANLINTILNLLSKYFN
ncbi:hypothetical protein [uncultured Clostridium sp.]|nr:hypothetical protein [uncultured Clostridium sp.]